MKKINLIKSFKYVLFVVTSLLYFEVLIYININSTLLEFSIFNFLFTISIALVLSFLIGWTNKIKKIDLLIVLFIVSIFYLIQLIYFKTFGSLASVSMIGVGNDAVENFSWSIFTTIKENILMVILFILPEIVLIIDCFAKKWFVSEYKKSHHFVVLILGIILWTVTVLLLPLAGTKDFNPYGAYHNSFTDVDLGSKKLGALPNTLLEVRYMILPSSQKQELEVIEEPEVVIEEPVIEIKTEYNKIDNLNFASLKNETDDENIKNICDYLNSVNASNKNDYTGMFKDYNLIYICAESFSRMAIDRSLTPTLYMLANNGIILKNYYNAFRNVTTNGEYAMLTGLWPDTARQETNMGRLTGTMGQSIDKDMSFALGNMFNNTGIQSRGYHNFLGSYYGRNETLPNMGFDCKFMNDGMEFTNYWPSSDLEMFEQSVDDYINEDRFCAYYMTFSGHGNYTLDNYNVQKNIDSIYEKLGDRQLPDNALGYYACNFELDLGLKYLITRLREANKLDKTVIVITGDHYPYYLTDESYESITGKEMNNDFEELKSTCIIYNSAMKTVKNYVPCSNVDILPTIYNLFGIDYDSRLFAGTDVFSDNQHIAVLYNKSYVTDQCIYNAENGNVIWLKDNSDIGEEELNKYVDYNYAIAKNKFMYSSLVEKTDFFRVINEYLDN